MCLSAVGMHKVIQHTISESGGDEYVLQLSSYAKILVLDGLSFDEFVWLLAGAQFIVCGLLSIRRMASFLLSQYLVGGIRTKYFEAQLERLTIPSRNGQSFSFTPEGVSSVNANIIVVEEYFKFHKYHILGYQVYAISYLVIGFASCWSLCLMALVPAVANFALQTLDLSNRFLRTEHSSLSDHSQRIGQVTLETARMSPSIIASNSQKEEINSFTAAYGRSKIISVIPKVAIVDSLEDFFLNLVLFSSTVVIFPWVYYVEGPTAGHDSIVYVSGVIFVVMGIKQALGILHEKQIHTKRYLEALRQLDLECDLSGLGIFSEDQLSSLRRAGDITHPSATDLEQFSYVNVISPKLFSCFPPFPTSCILLDDVRLESDKPDAPSFIFNVALELGVSTALLGESGCGKSTLLRVLMGLVAARRGKIWVDQKCLTWPLEDNSIDFLSWRSQFFYMPQVTLLQKKTIRENLLQDEMNKARPDEDLEVALRKACLDSWFGELEDGLDTVLNQGEQTLSGGQAQRFHLAKLFLSSKRIFLLDEPTSALDPVTTQSVVENLGEFLKGKTAIIVTHNSAAFEGICEAVITADSLSRDCKKVGQDRSVTVTF
ncbi:hypothetical protein CYMTET_39728 [Cymbomonas tetramitiformis]|uniref:ABC transporter domain-containing protein n=1 Tax=Cymbomonas tetramitiformis TaxID=36881 RepID=A0AAE0C9K0_9CHLO|nr:hypothetical protein CYMTET_39728 [Cymbomonas tetramitiformis]